MTTLLPGMLIVTNFASFPAEWTASSGERGSSARARSLREFLRHARQREAIFVVNGNPRLLLQLAAVLGWLPYARRPLISVDLVLHRPDRMAEKWSLGIKRLLFLRVDHYIHYFKDLRGYQEVFGIGPGRSSFVPFKVNLHSAQAQPDGEYVLCIGRSLRDFDTFFDAVERLPYPAAIGRPNPDQLRAHGARFTRSLETLPNNVRVLDDDGSAASLIRLLTGARLVVLPILKSNINFAGVSVGLDAMALGKCVIGSQGPGMSDIFGDEALTVPPEDPDALAEAIRRAWEDDELRARTAAAGHRYAMSAGGEPELYQRIIDRVVAWYTQNRR